MSGEGPESIPTSADPRSRRPTKKRALTPVSAQSASVEALFARPDQPIRLPSDALSRPRPSAAIPEIVTNVQGSSAGAGSGEFHVYKASRRREYERLKAMDEDVKRDQERDAFEREREEREKRDEEKTRKNREKREKMKARKAKKGKGGGNGAAKAGDGDAKDKGIKPNGLVARKDDKTREDEKEAEREDRDANDTNGTAKTAPSAEPAGIVILDDE
ncbi:hypothetical protein NLU13_3325 [Sarocladium strictum]|uniref:PRKR-interacting protein 1 n=1 Tax=Sarocladium strictum TaxID=5046 RepID=A0AA39GLU8_SARSR|nr:hypothetical protein NLU13_3325 [Sarocladium strictum]